MRALPRWLKVVLGLFAALLLLCLAGAGGAWWWLDANQGRLKEVGDRAVLEGQAFADGRDAEACLDEALTRLRAENGIVEQATHRVFLKECLARASRPPGFCDGVPAKGELSAQSLLTYAEWAAGRCAAKRRTQDQDCSRLMQVVQDACQSR